MSPESRVKSVAEAKTQAGRTYYKVSFEDGKTFSVFDRKLVQDQNLEIGTRVHYEAQQNDRGFWNLTDLRPLDQAPSVSEGTVSRPPESSNRESDRNRQVLSMNALNGAVSLFSALLEHKIITPRTGTDAIGIVSAFHAELMRLHEAPRIQAADRPAQTPNAVSPESR